jgi:hypothetical protein
MNLFYLDEDHDKNAQFHIDKHVSKMVLETAEMLSMCHLVLNSIGYAPRFLEKPDYQKVMEYRSSIADLTPEERVEDVGFPYIGRPAHINHPSTIWVRSSLENYNWAFCYMHALEIERRIRNPKGVPEHKSFKLSLSLPEPEMPDVGFTPFSLAMKDFLALNPEYKDKSPIEAYRAFYIHDKHSFASWKVREPPSWWPKNGA